MKVNWRRDFGARVWDGENDLKTYLGPAVFGKPVGRCLVVVGSLYVYRADKRDG